MDAMIYFNLVNIKSPIMNDMLYGLSPSVDKIKNKYLSA